ncbi:MAG: GntR family transcriptional regulator [Clostridiales Family XIII bacterium]|jgi:DNA-binding GntR family transcriptional regulator|nr:GntR family transcriptional regulator [Clostridiales Family XIII bacterium]
MANTEALSEELTSRLRIEILSEHLKPGAKLTEEELSKNFGVSRTPVRDAIRRLAGESLVELIPNRGAYVIGFSRGDVSDLYDLRCNAETRAASWAVQRFYEEELEKLEETYESMGFYAKRGDLKKLRELNETFHTVICEAAHNRILTRSLLTYRIYLTNSTHTKRSRREHIEAILSEHAAIFEAFVNRAPEEVAEAMFTHITSAKTRALR